MRDEAGIKQHYTNTSQQVCLLWFSVYGVTKDFLSPVKNWTFTGSAVTKKGFIFWERLSCWDWTFLFWRVCLAVHLLPLVVVVVISSSVHIWSSSAHQYEACLEASAGGHLLPHVLTFIPLLFPSQPSNLVESAVVDTRKHFEKAVVSVTGTGPKD